VSVFQAPQQIAEQLPRTSINKSKPLMKVLEVTAEQQRSFPPSAVSGINIIFNVFRL
jgi:hypothetical protein